MRPAVDDI